MPESLERASSSPEATRAFAAALGEAAVPTGAPAPRGGVVVSLLGDLGAGKTTFAQGLLHGLGVPPATPVVSPTFVFARSYLGRLPVHHLDAYLVSGLEALEASGFTEMCGDGRVTVVEWGDRIARALPSDRIEVELTPGPSSGPDAEHARRIAVRATGPSSARILARLDAHPAPTRSPSASA